MGSETRSASTEPITREDCIRFLREGEKPAGGRGVGLEIERLGVRADGSALPLRGPGGIFAILEELAARGGGRVHREGDAPFLVEGDLGNFSLEPGGQIEISSRARDSLVGLDGDVGRLLGELHEVSEPRGVRWLPLGVQPFAPLDSIEWLPRERYRIMARRMAERGDLAHRMMKQTCSVQVNLDFTDERTASRMIAAAMRADPFAIALFARSPLLEGRPAGDASARGRIWTRTDPDRCGPLRAAVEGRMGYAEWVDWALGVPMLFLVRDGGYRELPRLTFREFLDEGFQGGRAMRADWELHLTTLFPEARFKSYLEVRGADGAPRAEALAVAAFWKGLLYDGSALDWTEAFLGDIRWEEHRALHEEAIHRGLQGTFRGRSLLEWGRDLVGVARNGLRACRRPDDPDEERYLDAVEARLGEHGRSPSDGILEEWRRCGGDPESFVKRLASE